MKPLDTDYDCNCNGKNMVPQEPQEQLYEPLEQKADDLSRWMNANVYVCQLYI